MGLITKIILWITVFQHWKYFAVFLAYAVIHLICVKLFGEVNALLAISIFVGILTLIPLTLCIKILLDNTLTFSEKIDRLFGK